MTLLSVAEAQTRLLALAAALPVETVSLDLAADRWAAADIVARRTQPTADLSSMDGYALRFADLPGPLRLVGESAAGRPFDDAVAPGEAIRIFTGAALPPGTDTILIQEEALSDGNTVQLAGEGPPHRGAHVRPRGLDFSEGDPLIAAGEHLTPARLALAALAGHGAVPVRRRARVALIATGDELVAPGEPIGEGQLPEGNLTMLAAMLADLPVEISHRTILRDDLSTLTAAFGLIDADLIVTTGGASVGDHDLVRPALLAAGAEIDFWKIALRPGKPMMAGRLNGAVVLGLPGNPVSAFVTALLFAKPLVRALSGAADVMPPTRQLPLGAPLPANDHRQDYLRATIRGGQVFAASKQDSSMLRTLARADCLIVRPPHAPAATIGDSAEVLDLR